VADQVIRIPPPPRSARVARRPPPRRRRLLAVIAVFVALSGLAVGTVVTAAVLRGHSLRAVAGRGRDMLTGALHSVTRADEAESAPAAPPAPLSDSTRARLFQALVGPYVPAWAAPSLGDVFGRYERDFRTNDERQWAANGPGWANMNYYDRAAIYYAWYARTGDFKYLTRANAVAVDYRKNYLEANNFAIQPHWSMLDGVALHYLVTGDEASRTAVGKVADLLTGLGYRTSIGSKTGTDNRVQARYIVALLLANAIKAPSVGIGAPVGVKGGHDWPAELRRALPLILQTQDADGAWRLACKETKPVTHPFTTGLLFDALARYHDLFEPDPRIPPAIKRGADYLWDRDWIPQKRSFKYVGAECPAEGGPGPAPDLNNLIVNGFGFVYRQTRDITYRRRGDEIFGGAVTGAWLSPTKQFNQVYSSSYRYLAYTHPELQRDTTALPRLP